MLLACKARTQSPVTMCINTYTDDTAWDTSFKIIFGGKKAGCLRHIPKEHQNVVLNLWRHLHPIHREESIKSMPSGQSPLHKSPWPMDFINEITIIFYRSFFIGVLDDCTEISFIHNIITIVTFGNFDSTCTSLFSAGLLFVEYCCIYKEFRSFLYGLAVQRVKEHGHCFGSRSAFVQQRGIGYW